MPTPKAPPYTTQPHTSRAAAGAAPHETDDAFIERQFRLSIEALERVHALAPGEFTALVQSSAHTDEEILARTAHHEAIARRAITAAQRSLLTEDEFNIWSGRRKEQGEPVKMRFERSYARCCTPHISCQRGALTGIVRAYVRLQDELIAELIGQGELANTAAALFTVEQQAVAYGFLMFEPYAHDGVAGWPTFLRSTGRFRGATRLRQYFEQRQQALPLAPEQLEAIKAAALNEVSYPQTVTSDPVMRETPAPYTVTPHGFSPFRRLIACIARLFD
ncbi:MAG TPA: hypothetical protein VGL77_20160 [Armatimonadota bacterium]|jgi:hypothetical protein